MLLQKSFPQLSFAINNANADNTIYITEDPDVNKLTLVITTNTDNTNFSAGTPVPISEARDVPGSLLYLNLSGLQLSQAEFDLLEPVATNWAFAKYDPFTICMSPTQAIVLNSGAGSDISIAINKLTLSNPPATPNADLNVTSFRVPPVTYDNFIPQVAFFKVLLQQAPGGKKNLQEAISCQLSGDPYICNSIEGYEALENSISFVLKPGSIPVTVNAGPDTRFILSFVYAAGLPGYGALTTPGLATQIKTKQGQNAGSWSVTADPGQENPSWVLTPPDGSPIIGTGVQSIVGFDVSKIVTHFEPGPTLMFVQYQGIPGYNDGAYYLLLTKIPHVAINSFTATPNPAYLDASGKAKVHLVWEVANAGTLILYPELINVTGLPYYDTTIDSTFTFSLMASGQQLSNKGNIITRSLPVTVLPKINSFMASPQHIYFKSFPAEVELSWNVATKGTVRLFSSVTGESPYSFSAISKVTQKIKQPQMLTLVPDGVKDPIFQRSEVLSAFRISSRKTNTNTPSNNIAVLPAGNIVFTTNPDNNNVYALKTIDMQAAANPIAVGKKPQGVTVSPDGGWLYVANSGDDSVSVIKLTNKGGNFSMSLFTTITGVGTRPWSIAVSPLGDQLYVVNNAASGNGSLTIISQDDANEFSIVSTVALELAPTSVAVGVSGEYLFVTNSGSNTLSIVNRTPDDDFQVIKTLPTGKRPMGVAATPNGSWLFVCNADDNKVMIISATSLTLTNTILTTGKNPTYIGITPSSNYVFVSNIGDNTITLIGLDHANNKYRVEESGLTTGTKTAGLVISPNGNQVIIATGTEENISVLNLDSYEPSGAPIATKLSEPDSAAARPDRKKVAVWARPRPTGKRGQGINIIDTATNTITQVLVGQDIYDVLYSPAGGYVFVIQGKNDVLSLVVRSSSDFSEVKTITDLSGRPNRLAATINGDLLFVSLFAVGADEKTAVAIIDIIDDFTLLQTIELPSVSDTLSIPLAVVPDASKIFAVQNNQAFVMVKNKTGYKLETAIIPVGDLSTALGVLPDGSKAITVASESHSISVIDTIDYSVATYEIPENYSNYVTGLAISPDGSNIVVSNTAGATALMLDTLTYSVYSRLSVGKFPQFLTYLSDGSALYVPCLLNDAVTVLKQIQPVDFADTEALLAEAGAEAVGYNGMYIRKYLGQTGPIASGDAVTLSPDLIPHGNQQEIPSIFITPENWAKDMNLPVKTGEYNLIYVRGDNAIAEDKKGNLEMNWSPANLTMWPNNWADNLIPLSTDPKKFSLEVSAASLSKWVTGVPFQWQVPELPSGVDHFCIVGRLDEPVPWVQWSWSDLITWIKKPNVGWRNVYPVKKDTPTWQRLFYLNLPDDGKIPPDSKMYVYMDFLNMPIGIDVAFNCPDPLASPLINKKRTTLEDPNDLIGMWTKLPRGFNSYVTISFWSNGITIPPGAMTSLNTNYTPAALTDEEFEALCERFNGDRVHRDFFTANAPEPWYYVGACHNVVQP